jgi:hypothetical protein
VPDVDDEVVDEPAPVVELIKPAGGAACPFGAFEVVVAVEDAVCAAGWPDCVVLVDGKLVKLSFMVDKFNVLLITLLSDEKSNCLCCWSMLSEDELAEESSIIEFTGMSSLFELIIDEEDEEDKFMFAAELVCTAAVLEALVVALGAAVEVVGQVPLL